MTDRSAEQCVGCQKGQAVKDGEHYTVEWRDKKDERSIPWECEPFMVLRGKCTAGRREWRGRVS